MRSPDRLAVGLNLAENVDDERRIARRLCPAIDRCQIDLRFKRHDSIPHGCDIFDRIYRIAQAGKTKRRDRRSKPVERPDVTRS
jgi:hypothetical protein